MKRKVTDIEILEALENKGDDQTFGDLAVELGFTSGSGLSRRIKRLKRKIPDYVGEMVAKYAIEQVNNLKRNAQKGDTRAASVLLEMAGIYIRTSKEQIDHHITDQKVIYYPDKLPAGTAIEEKQEDNANNGKDNVMAIASVS